MGSFPDVVVIGAGPNGLAAAITVARAGHSVEVHEASATPGGGARTAELIEPGVWHDVCSAVHPFALASPFFKTLDLAGKGVTWLQPEVAVSHPIGGGRAAALRRDLDETAHLLGVDGSRYRRLMAPMVRNFAGLADDILRPPLSLPSHPVTLARFGLPGLAPTTALAKIFQTEQARALLAGSAAHSFLPLSSPLTSALALSLNAAGHAVGWPIPRGGARAITDALVAELESLGGSIMCGSRVQRLTDVPSARAIIFDTDPVQLADICGDHLPAPFSAKLRRFRQAPGIFKLDLILDGPVPWADPHSCSAGTVHVGGTIDEIAEAERATNRGRVPERPFTLVAQPSIVDPSRTPDHRHVLWTYCHVPNGSDVDMTATIEAQIERFAPGFRDRILARSTMNATALEAYNPNQRGGDIAGGSLGGSQLVARPVIGAAPYRTPNPAIFLGSASAPPGAGVHGMCGHLAAVAALESVLR